MRSIALFVAQFLYLIGLIDGTLLPWSYDTVALWADFGFYDGSGFSDYQAEFVATHYKIISIEKCMNGLYTVPAFYNKASQIRRYASSEETKILFYWSSTQAYNDCYDFAQNLDDSMWLKDSSGNVIIPNPSFPSRPIYDMTQQHVRDWWVESLVTVMKDALDQGIIINGVFADGMCSTRGQAYNDGLVQLMNQTKHAFAAINDDLFILGNGLIGYGFQPDHCVHIVPFIDGICMEHFGAFEEIDANGKWNPDKIIMWYQVTQSIVKGDYGSDKSIFVKAWIGPETQPIDSFGPSWPANYGARPSTRDGVAEAALELISFPLAAYLCGIYDKNVYFSYSYWYLIWHGYVPCPDNPWLCQCPADWYEEFTNRLGAPVAQGTVYDTYKCNRSFEWAEVYVDVSDAASAQIVWLTAAPTVDPTSTTATPTAAPTTAEPTMGPTMQPTTASPSESPTLSIKVLGNSAHNKSEIDVVVLQIVIIVVLLVSCVAYFGYRNAKMKKRADEQNTDSVYSAM